MRAVRGRDEGGVSVRLHAGNIVKLDDGLKHVVVHTSFSMASLACQTPAIPKDVAAWRLDDLVITCFRCMLAR